MTQTITALKWMVNDILEIAADQWAGDPDKNENKLNNIAQVLQAHVELLQLEAERIERMEAKNAK
jgi:hypothetical protein